jgi:hypothetical protein
VSDIAIVYARVVTRTGSLTTAWLLHTVQINWAFSVSIPAPSTTTDIKEGTMLPPADTEYTADIVAVDSCNDGSVVLSSRSWHDPAAVEKSNDDVDNWAVI